MSYRRIGLLTAIFLALLLGACNGGSGKFAPMTFTIGGTVSGLAAGQQVTLENNGGDSLLVAANGSFSFKTAVAASDGYSVTVATNRRRRRVPSPTARPPAYRPM